MSKSERFERFLQYSLGGLKEDENFEKHLINLLNHPKIDDWCLVDAYYYDYCTIPHEVLKKAGIYRDAYLVYGITKNGEMITKWVDRWAVDA